MTEKFARRSRTVRGLVVIWTIALSVVGYSNAGETVKNETTSVLTLKNGDLVTGTLVPASSEECLGWQSPVFVSPFNFLMSGLESVHFSAPSVLPPPEGAYSFELAGNDLLFGSLVSLDAQMATVEAPGMGRLTFDRSRIQRISRRGGGNDVLFVGPNGLNGWETPGDAGAWHEDAGHLLTDKPGAILRRNFDLPNQSRIEVELSWTQTPDFELAIAVDENSKTVSRAFRIDTWVNQIVIQRETEQFADVVPLQDVKEKSGRIHLQVFLDQKQGKIIIFSPAGERIAETTVTTANPRVYGGLQLTNRRGDIRLERLQIGRWTGETPRSVDVGKPRVHDIEGNVTYGTLTSYDPKMREFSFEEETGTKSIPENRIQDIFLPQSNEIPARSLRAVYLTGMKISGDVSRIENRALWLKSPGIQDPIEIPLDALQSLEVLKPKTEPSELPQKAGRLEVAGLTLHGCLVDGKADAESHCLVWQPSYSLNSSPLHKGISARIIYKETPPPTSKAQQNQAGRVVRPVPQRNVKKANSTTTKSKANPTASILHLITGDTIRPCEIVSIDEQGLTFKSPISAATFVPHEQIHAIELDDSVSQAKVDPKKFERLLTLPRMQRTNPPTQLFRDLDGDYLRGRLVAINENEIHVELRLEGKIIRRDRVARIIWLHPELSSNAAKDLPANANPSNTNLVQALHSSEQADAKQAGHGNRLTFAPEQVEGTILSGRSELFGVCRVDLAQIDELRVGSAIDKASAELPFGQWKLKQAADPLGPKESSEGSGDEGEGQESALIGKAAPDIALKSLDGKKFALKDYKDKVVILDFWASWCGPCIQVMPQVEKVAAEFAADGVELFAVNLEESPEKIKAALERLKLSPTVLLDRDGRVAERYGATSIPQTVIIDREGKVQRVFVGDLPRFEEKLRTAVKTVLSGGSQKAE